MSHETFVDTEVVPNACRFVNTNDAILVCSGVIFGAVIFASELVKLGQIDRFVNFSGSGSSWIFQTGSLTSITIDVEQ